MHPENVDDDAEVVLLECPADWPRAEDIAPGGGDLRLVYQVAAETRREGGHRSSPTEPQFVEYLIQVGRIWQSVSGPFAYAVEAAVTGVIGNYTYDMLKRLFGRYEKAEAPPIPPTTAGSAQRIALLAVRARCAELRFPAPPFRTLRVTEIGADSGVWTVRVAGGDLLDAEVRLPIEPILDDEPVEVLLRLRLPPTDGH